MGILSDLEPKKVFSFFEALCAIPHGSGNTARISDFCAAFARERGLEYTQDALGNVILIGPASPGYEAAPPIILQGHLDMVCVRAQDCTLDMAREGLRLGVDGDFVFAHGTSLGGDDGIAVAMALAVLDSPELPRPRVEAVFTVEEETGMAGAAGVDLAPLRGRRLVNLDSEAEGVFTVSCAGGATACCALPVMRTVCAQPRLRLTVDGLRGGHSGVDIHKGGANANVLLGRALRELDAAGALRLCALSGGAADNVIARSAQAQLTGPEAAIERALTGAAALERALRAEFSRTDPDLCLRAERLPAEPVSAVESADMARIRSLLSQMPNGVQAMSGTIPGLVQTSLNLGTAALTESALCLRVSLRSSAAREKQQLLAAVEAAVAACGGTVRVEGDYPAWELRERSPLREEMVRIYQAQYGEPPRIAALHAGLECGLFCGKLPELDCVSIGPDILDIHSPAERLSIPSVARVWRFLLELLRQG